MIFKVPKTIRHTPPTKVINAYQKEIEEDFTPGNWSRNK